MRRYSRNPLLILVSLFLTLACSLASLPQVTPTPPQASPTLLPATSTASATPTAADTSTPTLAPTSTATPSPSATPTLTPLPSDTPTLTPAPTYVKLRGEVVVEQANCRYGPGAPYLYKYGLVLGSNLEIIGRTPVGDWIEIQAIGGRNPCWVKASLMNIRGDVMRVQPIDPATVTLPMSPYYGPLTNVYAERKDNEVIVSWNALVLRAGDDSEQFPYLVEAWVCKDGQIVFTPTGSYATEVRIADQPGCKEPSHGRVYGVEKHGYTLWVQIPWPPAPTPTP